MNDRRQVRYVDTIYRRTEIVLKKPEVRRRIKWFAVLMLLINILSWFIGGYFITKPVGVDAIAQGDGIIVYGISGNSTPQYKTWISATSSWSSASSVGGATFTGVPRYIVSKAASTRNEIIVGTLNDSGTLYITRWNGSTWSQLGSNISTGISDARVFDITYENASGDAMVAIGGGADPLYYIWNGSTWSGPTTITQATKTSGTIRWIEIEPRITSGSDQIALAYADANGDLNALIWSGSGWTEQTAAAGALSTAIENNAAATTLKAFDLAYESLSGDLLIAWGNSATVDPRYVTYSAAGSWSSVLTATAFVEIPSTVELEAEPWGDRIAASTVDDTTANSNDGDCGTWDGGAWVNTGNCDIARSSPEAGDHVLANGWVTNGTDVRALGFYSDQDDVTLDYNYWAAGSAWTNTQSYTPSPNCLAANAEDDNIQVEHNPFDNTEMMILRGAGTSFCTQKTSYAGANTFNFGNAGDGSSHGTPSISGYMPISFSYNKYIPVAPLLEQIGYHWRNNDGDEADATSRSDGTENTSIIANKNTTLRLRVQISNEGTANHSGASYRIEYAQTATCSSGSYGPIPVTATTEHFNMVDAGGITDGSATTNIAVSTGGITDANSTFKAGQFKDTGNMTSSISLTTSEFTEIEYAITANNNSSWNTSYCFKVTDNGTDLDLYTQYAQLTTASEPPNIEQVSYRWRNDNGPEVGSPTNADEGPSGNEVVQTGWTSPTEAYSLTNDNLYATAAPAKNGNISSNFTTFGFGSSLPSNASINSVTLTAQYKVDTQASVADITVVAVVSGSDCGSGGNDTSEPTVDTDFPTDVTSCRSWTRDDLLDANFKVRVNAHRGNSNTAVTFSLDMVKVTVNYSTPGASFKELENTPHSGQAANENVRLRMQAKNIGGNLSQGYKVQYVSKSAACNTISSGWTVIPVTATTEHFEYTTSSNFTDLDSTQNINPGLNDPAGSFVAGYLTEDPSNMSGAVSLAANDFTELEYNFQGNNNASGEYCFRLVRGASDTQLDIYTSYPELSFASANNNPNSPVTLTQKTSPGGVGITESSWTTDNTPDLGFTITDPDSDTVIYQILIADNSSFTTPIIDYTHGSYSASGTVFAFTIGSYGGGTCTGSCPASLADSATGYWWKVKAIDVNLAESSYVEFGVVGTMDLKVDATVPSGGTIYDGNDGTEHSYNDYTLPNPGSLTQLSAYWTATQPNFDVSGKTATNVYQYAIGTTQGGTDIKTWTYTGTSGTDSFVDATGLTLQTSQMYYFSVKAYDMAGNMATLNSNGQEVLPTFGVTFIHSGGGNLVDLGIWEDPSYTGWGTTDITTTTNAYNGYQVYMYKSGLLQHVSYPSRTVADLAGGSSWATPLAWATACPGGTACFGYTSNDPLVSGSNRFSSGSNYCAISDTGPGDIVADDPSPQTSGQTRTITYKVQTNTMQAAGKYSTNVYYSVVPQY